MTSHRHADLAIPTHEAQAMSDLPSNPGLTKFSKVLANRKTLQCILRQRHAGTWTTNIAYSVCKSAATAAYHHTRFWLLCWALMLPSAVYAHRGAGNEIDACRIQVGYERIHFAAYPQTSKDNKGYCNSIPTLEPTNLVFDYEGKKLRNVTVEFEITKEPEATRVFYQEPTRIKTGTFSGIVDFSKFGAGDYLAHIAIVDKDKKLDTHIPFSVGVEAPSDNRLLKFLLAIAAVSAAFYAAVRWLKAKESHSVAEKHNQL